MKVFLFHLFRQFEIGGGIAAFGVDRVHFKGAGKRENTLALMRELSIEVH